jgi:hypothetical protein
MRPLIDAWLERHDPILRLLDADTGRELARWGPDRVRPMLEAGTLWLPDLLDESLGLSERSGEEP